MATRKKDWSLTDRLLEGGGDRVNPSRRSAVGSRLSPAYRQEAQRNRMFGGGGGRNPAALASQRMDPANTRKVVSKLVNQFNQRDSVDRQGRFSAPSPDRLRERSTPNYNEMTYSQPDLSSVGRGDTKSGYPTPAPARHVAKDPSWRGGPWSDQSNVPLRQQAAGGPSPSSEVGKRRRTQSTESAFRSADASMFDSTVTPKAAPIKDYKPRGKVTKDKNIQAFY